MAGSTQGSSNLSILFVALTLKRTFLIENLIYSARLSGADKWQSNKKQEEEEKMPSTLWWWTSTQQQINKRLLSLQVVPFQKKKNDFTIC